MPENVVDSIRIEIIGDSGNAIDSLEKLISTLEKIKSVTESGNKGFQAVQGKLAKVSEAVQKIDSASVSKLHELAGRLKELSGVKISGKIAERITSIGAAADGLKNINLSKFGELTHGLKGLQGFSGAVKQPAQPLTVKQPAQPLTDPASLNKNLSALRKIEASTYKAKEGIEGYKLAVESIDVDKFVSMTSKTELLRMQLDGAKNKLQELLNSGEVKSPAVADLTSKIKSLQKELDLACKKGEKLKIVFRSAFGAGAKNIFGKISKGLRTLTKMFARRALYRLMNAVISAVTSAFKEGVSAVYQYSKALNGSLAKSLDSIATSLNYLKGSLGAMAAPIINILAPAIERAVDKFVDLLNIANQVFARLSGASTWTKAIKVPAEYAVAVDKATAANKRLKKSLLGIDEINALTDNANRSPGGSNLSDTSKYAFKEVPLDVPYVDDVIKKLKDISALVGVIGVGILSWDFGKAILGLKNLKDGLKNVQLAGGLTLGVTSLVIEVEGLIDIKHNGINWQNFSKTILAGAGVTAAGALIGKALGKTTIGAATGGITAGLPMFITGISTSLTEGISGLSATLTALGSTLMGASIGVLVGHPAIGALIGLAVGAVTDLTIYIIQNWDKISEFLSGIGDWIYDHVFAPVRDFLSGAASWVWKKVIKPIVDFFTPIKDAVLTVFTTIYTNARDIIKGIIKAIKSIVDKVREIADKIVEIFKALGKAFYTYVIVPVCAFVKKHIIEPVKKAAIWFYDTVLKPIGGFFKSIGTWVYDHIIKPVWEKIVKLKDNICEIFKKVGTTVVNFVSNLFKSVVNGVLGGIERTINGFIKMLNGAITIINKIPGVEITKVELLSIPRLESGGVVNAGTAFIAGEAGAEVMGNIGRRTGVMNTDEMRKSVEQGVMDANMEQNAILREGLYLLRKLLEKDDGGTPYPGTDNLINSFARKNRRDGKTIVPVGV